MSGSARVVVVGGGLAGITAALDLAEAGAEVTLLELAPRLGGATWSFRRGGLWVDNGQHVFLACCTAYRALLERLGVASHTVVRPFDVPVLRPGRPPARLRRPRLPAPFHALTMVAAYRALAPSARVAALRAGLAMRRLAPEDPALDEMAFGTWLAEHGQGPGALEALWGLIGLATLNVAPQEASLALAAKVVQTGLLETADASDLGLPTVPLSELHGRPALRALEEAGVALRLKTRVERLGRDRGGGRAGCYEVCSASGTLRADAVVLAVTPRAAARLVPLEAFPAASSLAELGASPIVNVHLVFDRTVAPYPVAAAVGSPLQWLFDRTSAAGLERGQYLVVSLSGADRYVGRRPSELVATFLAALEALLPEVGRAAVTDAFVTKEPEATFRARPGTASLRPGPCTAWPGLVLAGAFTATGWPASMEGAVRSGHAAAHAVLEALGGAPLPGAAEREACGAPRPAADARERVGLRSGGEVS